MKISQRSISVVLPVHQQEDHIGQILLDLFDGVRDLTSDLQMIVLVNASSDRSAEMARSVASQCPGMIVVELAEAGWGSAVRSGLSLATGDLLCFTNSARTTPRDLRTAVALGLLNEHHAVKAIRRSRESVIRRMGSVLYNFEARTLFGLASWDINGTPKVFPREMAVLLELQEDGDLLDLEWLVECIAAHHQLIEYPVTSVRRHSGRSTTRLRSAIRMYVGAFRLRRRLRGRPALAPRRLP